MSAKQAAFLSTLFDLGGIVGGILAGVMSDVTGRSATTCAVMLAVAIPGVRLVDDATQTQVVIYVQL